MGEDQDNIAWIVRLDNSSQNIHYTGWARVGRIIDFGTEKSFPVFWAAHSGIEIVSVHTYGTEWCAYTQRIFND